MKRFDQPTFVGATHRAVRRGPSSGTGITPTAPATAISFASSGPRATRITDPHPRVHSIRPQRLLGTALLAGAVVLAVGTQRALREPKRTALSIGSSDTVIPSAAPHLPSLPVDTETIDAPFSIDREHLALVSKDGRWLTLYQKVQRLPVGVGKNPGNKRRVGDLRTPECQPGQLFPITRKVRNPSGSQFGSRYLELLTPPWSGIAIHGTDEPETIGTAASHGCIRMLNQDVTWLYDKVHVGDPVLIRP